MVAGEWVIQEEEVDFVMIGLDMTIEVDITEDRHVMSIGVDMVDKDIVIIGEVVMGETTEMVVEIGGEIMIDEVVGRLVIGKRLVCFHDV